MLNLLCDKKGSIGIALVIVVISVLSGLSLTAIAFRDSSSFRQQLEAFQQFHFLRSEAGRGRVVASVFEGMEQPPVMSSLPIRRIRVNFDKHRTIYTANTKIAMRTAFAETGFDIQSLITAVRGSGDIITPDITSPVKRFGILIIRSLQTMAIFHYFSDIDRDASDIPGNIRFFGLDVVNGRVHSNTDIWIMNSGTGPNGGWPTFLGLVTTCGVVRVYPGGHTNFPREQIFLGGLIEGYPRIAFEPSADLVKRYGGRPLGNLPSDDKIGFVTIDGASYVGYVGEIETGPIERYVIRSSYPPYGPVGDSIGYNDIARKDTVWSSPLTGSLVNTSAFVPFELWISGSFRGGQTWGSSHNIYLKDDLTYEGTSIGQNPDGSAPGTQMNTRDYLGIVSEQHVIIQYGYRHPIDSLRYKPNTQDIYIYGALCALGQGDVTHEDGVFTFQYHFPKGSTPDQSHQGEWFEKIDLYRFHYPTTSLNPWPPGLDYPWYNPIWPEPGPVFGHLPIPNPHGTPETTFLRGDINLYGSIAQRRRGFVRRSGNVDFDTGIWDLENYIYGRHTDQPSGYNKNYNFDTRFENVGPPHFPLVKFEGYESDELMDLGYETIRWIFKDPPAVF